MDGFFSGYLSRVQADRKSNTNSFDAVKNSHEFLMHSKDEGHSAVINGVRHNDDLTIRIDKNLGSFRSRNANTKTEGSVSKAKILRSLVQFAFHPVFWVSSFSLARHDQEFRVEPGV